MEWPEFFAKLAREETHEEELLRERKQVQKAILEARSKGYTSAWFKDLHMETRVALLNGGFAVEPQAIIGQNGGLERGFLIDFPKTE